MPKYNEIGYDRIEPISFDEMIKPALMYKAEYEKEQEGYQKLLEDAQKVADLEKEGKDSAAYKSYMDYIDRLNTFAESLNSGKLDIPGLSTLRQDYIKTLKPYETKLTKKGELVAKQMEKAGPGVMFDVDYTGVPLEDITANSSFRTYNIDDYIKSISSSLSGKYISNGYNYGSEEEEINDIMKTIDTEGLSKEQINRLRSGVKAGRDLAVQAAEEYKLQQQYKERELAVKERNSRRTGGGGGGGSSSSSTVSLRGATDEEVTLADGSTVTTKVKTVDGQKHYYNPKTKQFTTNPNELSASYKQNIALNIGSGYYGSNESSKNTSDPILVKKIKNVDEWTSFDSSDNKKATVQIKTTDSNGKEYSESEEANMDSDIFSHDLKAALTASGLKDISGVFVNGLTIEIYYKPEDGGESGRFVFKFKKKEQPPKAESTKDKSGTKIDSTGVKVPVDTTFISRR